MSKDSYSLNPRAVQSRTRSIRRFDGIAVLAPIACAMALTFSIVRADADESQEAFHQAEQAEKTMDFSRALQAYQHALEAQSYAAFASTARARADDLAAHAEGSFVPLTRLESVRRDAAKMTSPQALVGLAAEADTFPPGQVRTEARLLCASALIRLGREADAIGPLQAVMEDGFAGSLHRARALGQLVDLYEARGEAAQARDIARRYKQLDPTLWNRLRIGARRYALRDVALSVLALLLVSVFVAMIWTGRYPNGSGLRHALVRPVAITAIAVIAFGGALLTHRYDTTLSTYPFWLLGAGIFMVDTAIALLATVVSRQRGARIALATGGVVAVSAVAFLALFWSDPIYLENFGL